MAERREVGGAVPRDRGRAPDAREARFGEDPGTALEVFGVGALDDHEARADARDHDPPDRRCRRRRGAGARRRGRRCAAARSPMLASARCSAGVGALRSTRRSAPLRWSLAQRRVQRRDGSCQTSVTTDVERARARRRGSAATASARAARARGGATAAAPGARERRRATLEVSSRSGTAAPIVAEPTPYHRASPARRRTSARGS